MAALALCRRLRWNFAEKDALSLRHRLRNFGALEFERRTLLCPDHFQVACAVTAIDSLSSLIGRVVPSGTPPGLIGLVRGAIALIRMNASVVATAADPRCRLKFDPTHGPALYLLVLASARHWTAPPPSAIIASASSLACHPTNEGLENWRRQRWPARPFQPKLPSQSGASALLLTADAESTATIRQASAHFAGTRTGNPLLRMPLRGMLRGTTASAAGASCAALILRDCSAPFASVGM